MPVTRERDRGLTWRQGQILPPEAALALELVTPEEIANCFPVVITHDCDLTAAFEKEPLVEILVGRLTSKLGAAANAKIARHLEVNLQSSEGPRAVVLRAPDKRAVPKAALFAYAARGDLWLAPQDRLILQRWLAARYRRAAFPEAFEARLRQRFGGRRIVDHIESILGEGGQWIRCLLFDLDEGDIRERDDPDDVYRLGVTVLYAGASDEPRAYAAACVVADAMERLFAGAFERPGGTREYIDLVYCEPIADTALTVQQREQLTEWRLEYLSLAVDPPHPMVTD
jgi:hypothetical protein